MTEIDEVRMLGAPASTVARRRGAAASLVLATLGFFLITLDVSIINLALPSIAADLGGDTSAQQWILDGYTLFFAALLLFAGNLSDRLTGKEDKPGQGCGHPEVLLQVEAGQEHGAEPRRR